VDFVPLRRSPAPSWPASCFSPRWRTLAQAGHEHEHAHAHEATEAFGNVHFPTSCRPGLDSAFDRAMALLHSFAYAEAAKAFADVAAKDSACAMAQWASR
jgi:hypothetical protein